MLVRFSAISLAVLIAANAVSAQPYPWDTDPKTAATVHAWIKEVQAVIGIRLDPLLKTIVCRVPYTNFTMDSLAKATGVTKVTLAHAVSELVDKGLIGLDHDADGTMLIVPANERAREKMRKWAENWCTSDESCGVQR